MGTHPRTAAPDDALSTMLREGTSVNHREAERRPFMRVFFKGETPRDAYVEWMARQWFVYDALEDVAEKLRGDEVVGRMYTPALLRRDRLAADLEVLIGSDWREQISPSPVTERYVERIRWCGDEFRPGWVAHQWLRYLGNVGGQQVLRRLGTKVLGLDGSGIDVVDTRGDGLDFFRYDVGEVGPFFADYHQRLNSMPLDLETKQQVVDEGDAAFQLNMDLTDELANDFGIEAPEGDPDQEYEALNADD